MGEVYRARDANLRRDVALKILPQSLAADGQRRARLVHEAHILATLNHPAIASVFDLHDADGVVAVVMELVDGETLADRLAAGPIAIPDALRIAAQIVDALDTAHENGVVHRDLKPANIKLTTDDRVKVLDFGLAKAVAIDSDIDIDVDMATSPTISVIDTRVGAIHGTPGYMSPEQAKGKAIDKRADIWAFGCVLFEMLAGRPAFVGDDLAQRLVAVLTAEPDWQALPAGTPSRIVELLKRCLKRQPRERLRDIGDARFDLAHVDAAADTRPGGSRIQPERRAVTFQRLTDFIGMNGSPAISPDGKMLAFVAAADGHRHIWVRLLAPGGTLLQLTRGNADHERPRWAPDSSTLIYYTRSASAGASGAIWQISALGGTPRPIAPALGGGDISHDGRHIAVFQAVDGRVELAIVSREGAATTYVRPLPPLVIYESVRWSPDDRFLAFHAHVERYFDQRIFVMPSAGGAARNIVRGAFLKGFAWLPDGSGVVYSSAAGSALPYPPTFNLRAVGIDGSHDRQVTFGDASYVEPDVHVSGRLLTSLIRSRSDIWRFPIDGSPAQNTRDAVRITRQSGRVQTPSVSPDGRELVFLSDSGGHGNLWVTPVDGGDVRQITFEHDPRTGVGVPMWSPTGDRIVFLITREGTTKLWVVNADGTGLRELHVHGFYPCWSGDGQWMYYSPLHDRPWRILKVPIDGGEPVEVRNDNAVAPAVAADPSVLYYAALVDRGGTSNAEWEIRAARPENGASQVLVRIGSSRIPVSPTLVHMALSHDGRCLAIPLTDGTTTNVWAVRTDTGAFEPLTDFAGRPTVISRRVSWAPDGRSLYAAVEETDADIVSIEGLLAEPQLDRPGIADR